MYHQVTPTLGPILTTTKGLLGNATMSKSPESRPYGFWCRDFYFWVHVKSIDHKFRSNYLPWHHNLKRISGCFIEADKKQIPVPKLLGSCDFWQKILSFSLLVAIAIRVLYGMEFFEHFWQASCKEHPFKVSLNLLSAFRGDFV